MCHLRNPVPRDALKHDVRQSRDGKASSSMHMIEIDDETCAGIAKQEHASIGSVVTSCPFATPPTL